MAEGPIEIPKKARYKELLLAFLDYQAGKVELTENDKKELGRNINVLEEEIPIADQKAIKSEIEEDLKKAMYK